MVKGKGEKKHAGECPGCTHKKPFVRHAHYLKVLEGISKTTHENLSDHLRRGHEDQGWVSAKLQWADTIRGLYWDIVGQDGSKIPLWQAWADSQKQAEKEMDTRHAAFRKEHQGKFEGAVGVGFQEVIL